jgi:Mg/Co/Ni transporter MgtE
MSSRPLDLTLSFLQHRPRRAARVLDELEADDVAAFLETAPKRIAGPAVGFMLRWRGAACLALLPADQAAGLIESMDYYDAIGLLRETVVAMRPAILDELPHDLARKIEASLRYPEGTVGSLMNPSAPLFAQDASVDDALYFVRDRRGSNLAHVFLHNAQGRFAGAVAIAALLRAGPNTKLEALADRSVSPISSRAALASMAKDSGWDDYPMRPVIGSRHILIGSLSRIVLRRALTQHKPAPLHHQVPGLVASVVTMYLDSFQGLLRFIVQPATSGEATDDR